MKRNTYLIFALLLLLLSCQEEVFEEEIIEEVTPLPGVLIEAAAAGFVVDEDGEPLADVKVLLGSEETRTNPEGYFSLESGFFPQSTATLKAVVPGYIPTLTYLAPGLGELQAVVLRPQAPEVNEPLQAESGLTFEIAGKMTGRLGGSSIEESDGSSYSGQLSLLATSLLAGEEFAVVGHFLGRDELNRPLSVNCVSGIAFFLESPTGQALYLQSGKAMKTEFTIPSNWSGATPEEIALWQFQTDRSAWVQKGTARKEGNHYTADLSGTGYWCIGKSRPVVYLSGSFRFQNRVLTGIPAYLYTESGAAISRTFLGPEGELRSFVPANEQLTISVPIPGSEERQELWNLSSGTTSLDMGVIELQSEPQGWLPVDTRFMDCQGQAVDESMFILRQKEHWILTTSSEDELSFGTISNPSENTLLRALELEKGSMSTWLEFRPKTHLKTGSLAICEDAPENFLKIQIEQEIRLYQDLKWATEAGPVSLFSQNETLYPELEFLLRVEGVQEGNYEDDELNLSWVDPNFGDTGFSFLCPTSPTGCGFTRFEILEYGDQAGLSIKAAFEGEFWMQTLSPPMAAYYPVSGEIQIKRNN
jgi:hypothetical protein